MGEEPGRSESEKGYRVDEAGVSMSGWWELDGGCFLAVWETCVLAQSTEFSCLRRTSEQIEGPPFLDVLRLQPGRNFCKLDGLSKQVGWKHQDLFKRLEDQRKVESNA